MSRRAKSRAQEPLRDGMRVRITAHVFGEGRGVVGSLMGDGVGLGGLVSVMTEGGPASCMYSEVEVLEDQTPQPEPMRYRLPYGMWTCSDGREVLFNRDYEPIWERRPGEVARPADRGKQPARVGQQMFYSDSTAPWRDKESLRRCERVLADWGVTAPERERE